MRASKSNVCASPRVGAATAIAAMLSAGLFSFAAAAQAADPATCTKLVDDGARLACYDAAFSRPSTPIAAQAPSASVSTTEPEPEQNFGAEQLPQSSASKAAAAKSINAHIQGTFEGWDPKMRFKLDNGQIWQVTSDSSVYYTKTLNPAVTVEKGIFGGYFLRIEGVNQRARVKRIQ